MLDYTYVLIYTKTLFPEVNADLAKIQKWKKGPQDEFFFCGNFHFCVLPISFRKSKKAKKH